MKKIFLYTLAAALMLVSCTANKQPAASCCKKPAAETASTALPEESLYNVPDSFVNQKGERVQLKDFAGKITVASMVFTHCAYACPRLTEDIKVMAAKLEQAGIKEVNYVLVSFDTERDSPARLRQFAAEMNLNENWTLLRGDEQAVRQLSVLLNVQYEKAPDGSFSHSNLISVLDQQGRMTTQLEGLEARNTETIAAIRQLAVQ